MPFHTVGFDILESLPDALLITDAGGVIAYVNAQFCDLFGYASAEVLGAPLDRLMPERFRNGHDGHVARFVREPRVRPMGDCSGFYAVHKDGTEFPVEIYLSPLQAKDRLFVMAAVRDISAHARLEEELRRARDELDERVRARTAELQETARHLQVEMRQREQSEERLLQLQSELSHVARLGMIGEMSAGLGHELNQPLAAISNYAQGCIRRLQAGKFSTPELVEALQRITRESARAGDILTRFRRFAKREQLDRDWVNVGSLIVDAVQLAEVDAIKHGVELDLHLNGVLPQLYLDPLQIQQVTVNLIRNAIEATSDAGGRKQVEVHVTRDNGQVRIAVVDAGHGLLAESVEQLFAPFFSTKPNGLGMGLSLSQRIVEAHGGELSAHPNEGRGMTFYFLLPIVDVSAYDA